VAEEGIADRAADGPGFVAGLLETGGYVADMAWRIQLHL
jgi:hypothetical protein